MTRVEDIHDITERRRAPDLGRLTLAALVVAAAGIVLAVVITLIRHGNWREFFHAYLVAWLMCLGLALGCIALGLLVSVVGGRWGEVIRPVLAIGSRAIVLVAVLFIPLVLNLPANFPWALHDALEQDVVLKRQHDIWMKPSWVVGRSVAYFVIWFGLAWAVNAWSARRDRHELLTEQLPGTSGLAHITGPGILLYGVTATFAAIDFVMSTEKRWYSTVFGLSFIAGTALGALALGTLVVCLLTEFGWRHRHRRDSEFGKVDQEMSAGGEPAHGPLVKPTDFGDLGNLTIAFTMLWAYLAFSQFLIIWAGNLPAEVRYYAPRVMTHWRWVGLLLIIGHFAIPFFTLFSRDLKRNPRVLGRIAAFVLVMRAVDWIWLIEPSVRYNSAPDSNVAIGAWVLIDLCMIVGLGGLWAAFFCWQLSGRVVLPLPIADDHAHGGAHPESHGTGHPAVAHGVAHGAPGAGGHHA